MKTLKVSDAVHRELTRLLGEMMAQSGKPQTFSDVIEALFSRSVLLPPEMLRDVEDFIEANKQLDYTPREEFIREAVNETLSKLSGKYEYVKSPKENSER
jgi:predicted CopG family antitoxin